MRPAGTQKNIQFPELQHSESALVCLSLEPRANMLMNDELPKTAFVLILFGRTLFYNPTMSLLLQLQ